ncbi:MAG TPA: glycosyltransferase [Spirochaetota bacterium]|nr:glycosyltransferase [Spirochaetota bacterium]
MNIWFRYFDDIIVFAPLTTAEPPNKIDIPYAHNSITFLQIPPIDILSPRAVIRSIALLPLITFKILKGMTRADHIHLRCPGNVGLIGSIVQILFPKKKKTAKYASNWDWNSRQPWSYRLQQCLLRNTFLTRNMTALVYGEWPDRTKNIKPFFTASYSEIERLPVHKTPLNEGVQLAFIGTLTRNKNPLDCSKVLFALTSTGINATLTYCGDGPEQQNIEEFIDGHRLHDKVKFLGNVDSETVKKVLQEAHFLIFLSRSEGWPKAISEAMWWGCLPITTAVSCVPQMLGNSERGELVNGEITGITSLIEGYIADQNSFNSKSGKAMDWSREYTTERFEKEIQKLL